jgi:hypothetical protein
LVERVREPIQDLVGKIADGPQRMIHRYPLFRGQVAEHGRLLDVVASHKTILRENVFEGENFRHFSAAC